MNMKFAKLILKTEMLVKATLSVKRIGISSLEAEQILEKLTPDSKSSCWLENPRALTWGGTS